MIFIFKVCSLFGNIIDLFIFCDFLCGIGIYYSVGRCFLNGCCLCWWGWIGLNVCYIDGGFYNNRIIVSDVYLICE